MDVDTHERQNIRKRARHANSDSARTRISEWATEKAIVQSYRKSCCAEHKHQRPRSAQKVITHRQELSSLQTSEALPSMLPVCIPSCCLAGFWQFSRGFPFLDFLFSVPNHAQYKTAEDKKISLYRTKCPRRTRAS